MTPLPTLCDEAPCGACCLGLVSPPFFFHDDARWLDVVCERPDLALEIAADRAARQANGGPHDGERPCLWLDPATRRCRNYDYRPDICREFDVGGDDCLAARQREGIGHAK